MIVVTGAAGFIGSCLLAELDARGYHDLVMVDDFDRPSKKGNTADKQQFPKVDRNSFHEWLDENHKLVYFIFHIGARTDTTEFDASIFDELNLEYSKEVWKACARYGIPLVYASSAATYGGGEHGYDDDHELIPRLQPLNPYADSKQAFDLWALSQEEAPYFWAGLKFFNVYGPNEYHKGRMASVVFHAYNQIKEKGEVRLFRSHNPDYADGGQLRDFIYVKDVVDVCIHLMETRKAGGIFNLGTGEARTFLDLATAVFEALGEEPNITFIDTPEDIRDKYQYYTQAEMGKLRRAGYQKKFHSLEEGVKDYVVNYLIPGRYR
ncbi:MAG TPA: ADP-glyceromanno-heptose 6-epimerase [Cryomorphaceae bacterium]|nr:ADP-glyceromanno-heptose 6-epimerase [Cryomorphaceae bacterium]